MAQKVHPVIFRIGQNKTWKSRWFAPDKKQYREYLAQDVQLRSFLLKKLAKAGIENIEIERTAAFLKLIIYTSRAGLLIGRGGGGAESLRDDVKKFLQQIGVKQKFDIKIQIEQLAKPETHAQVIAFQIAEQLEKRMPFRRVLKQSLEKIMQSREVKGAKIKIKGRLGGAEIARKERLAQGQLPLQTLRADIDFALATAFTTYGTIGIKVWVYKGEKFE